MASKRTFAYRIALAGLAGVMTLFASCSSETIAPQSPPPSQSPGIEQSPTASPTGPPSVLLPSPSPETDQAIAARLLRGLDSQPMLLAQDAWMVAYSGQDTLVFYNRQKMASLRLLDSQLRLTGVQDFSLLYPMANQDGLNLQVDINASGRYAMVSNQERGGGMSAQQPLVLVDLYTGQSIRIGTGNYYAAVSAWSAEGRFYAWADKNGQSITIYQTETGLLQHISGPFGSVSRVWINDAGDVFFQGSQEMMMPYGMQARHQAVPGTALGFTGDKLLCYEAGILYGLDMENGQPTELFNETDYTYAYSVSNFLVFRHKQDARTMLYQCQTGKTSTLEGVDAMAILSLAPDGKAHIRQSPAGPVVIGADGRERAIEDERFPDWNMSQYSFSAYHWLNEGVIARVVQCPLSIHHGQFYIEGYRIEQGDCAFLFDPAGVNALLQKSLPEAMAMGVRWQAGEYEHTGGSDPVEYLYAQGLQTGFFRVKKQMLGQMAVYELFNDEGSGYALDDARMSMSFLLAEQGTKRRLIDAQGRIQSASMHKLTGGESEQAVLITATGVQPSTQQIHVINDKLEAYSLNNRFLEDFALKQGEGQTLKVEHTGMVTPVKTSPIQTDQKPEAIKARVIQARLDGNRIVLVYQLYADPTTLGQIEAVYGWTDNRFEVVQWEYSN